jgi:Fic family protein
MAEELGHPTLIALSQAIEKDKKAYYTALQGINRSNEITDWLVYFANTVLKALALTQEVVDFSIKKAKFYGAYQHEMNPRQAKVIGRLFDAGTAGFKGGLSAENYISITKASRATTTRDLQDLVRKGALRKTGELKHTRYFLKLP